MDGWMDGQENEMLGFLRVRWCCMLRFEECFGVIEGLVLLHKLEMGMDKGWRHGEARRVGVRGSKLLTRD